MNNFVLCAWYAVGDPAVSGLMAAESAVLVILAASLLVFRTFRERYLLIWIVGWLAYFVSGWTLRIPLPEPVPRYVVATSHAQFVLALCLFASAILIYCHKQKLLLPLLLASGGIATYAVAQALYWPDSLAVRSVLEISYRLIALWAAVQLIRFRWARWEIGPWLLGASLLMVHLEWEPLDAALPPGFRLVTDLVLGLSMLLVVFDDFLVRTRRLGVVNALTSSITRARQHGPMLVTALEELKHLMLAKAAWFRLVEGDKMVIAQQIGLSEEFVRTRSSVAMEDVVERVLNEGQAVVVKTGDMHPLVRPHLEEEGFCHVVVVPVRGKKAVIGTLSLGSRHHLSYTPDDLEFLATSAHQLGLAVENLRLVEQIVRSQRQWANTFNSIHDIVLLHDSEFRVMKANQALLQRLAMAPADVAGKTCEAVLPRVQDWQSCPYCSGSEDGLREAPDPCFGGHSIVSTSSYTEEGGEQKGAIHVVRDITDRRIAEENYRRLFERMQEGVFVATPEGRLLDCNDAFLRMLGRTREEVLTLNMETDLYVFNAQREQFRQEITTQNYVRNFEVTMRRKDGAQLTVLESSFAVRDEQDQIVKYQGFLLDITEKKQAENEIRRRNRELNALNAMAVIATQSFDLDEILNLTLRQVISLLGAEAGSIYLADANEKTFRRRATGGQRSAERTRVAEVDLPEGFGDLVTRSRTDVLTSEYLPHLPARAADFVRADGNSSWVWVLLWSKDKLIGLMSISSSEGRQYTNNDENLLVGIGRQLATTVEKVRLYEETCRAYEDLRRTQEQLLQSEKMSAVGQLISGVAHELNNPLTAILGYAQLLESEGLGERATDFVTKLFKQAQRTHRVVQNLLSFARQRKLQKQQVDLRKVMDETLALRDYDLRVNRVKIEREFDETVPAVTADPHQLEQVFLNIVNNAVDAMLEAGKGGTLKVRMFAEDGSLYTEVHDSGPGIKEPSRIFEPFYTTKSVGKGTGLGLSICYGIIKEHGGEISARNGEQGGAILAVRLPATGQATAVEEPVAAPRRDMAIQGRILLVEDEEGVMEFERDVLTGAGAQVTTVMNEERAKLLLQERTFDAVIIDGKMANHWSAPDAYRWLAKTCPGMEKHLLFTFSNLPEPEIRTFLRDNHVPCLVKPFEVSDLISQARRVLQKALAAHAI